MRVARDPDQLRELRMERLRVEAIAVRAGERCHLRPEAADDDRRRRFGPEESRGPIETVRGAGEARGIAGPQPAYDLDGFGDALRADRIGVDAQSHRFLLSRVRCAPTPARADAEQQAPTGYGLQRRRHVREQPWMAVRHVQDERTE